MALSSNPYTTSNLQDDGKWGDIGGISDVGPPIKITDSQIRDAQLNACRIDNRRNVDRRTTKELLSMLGIDERVVLDGPSADGR